VFFLPFRCASKAAHDRSNRTVWSSVSLMVWTVSISVAEHFSDANFFFTCVHHRCTAGYSLGRHHSGKSSLGPSLTVYIYLFHVPPTTKFTTRVVVRQFGDFLETFLFAATSHMPPIDWLGFSSVLHWMAEVQILWQQVFIRYGKMRFLGGNSPTKYLNTFPHLSGCWLPRSDSRVP